MKKIICILLTMFTLSGMLCGCQETPEEVVVVQKNTDRLVEMAQATPQPDEEGVTRNSPLRERLGIPERWEETIQQEGDELKVIVDADVQVPDEEYLPTARGKADNFSQELIDRFYDELLGDTVMYQFTTQRTKAELEKEIILAEKQLAEAEDWEKSVAESILEATREEYAKAPEEVTLEIADGKLQSRRLEDDKSDHLDGDQTWLDVMENTYGGKEFSVYNNTEYDNAVGVGDGVSWVDENGNVQGHTPSSGATLEYHRRGRRDSLLENSSGYVYADATEQSLNGESVEGCRIRTTAKEARAIVEEFIENTGITYMAVDEVSLMSNVYGQAGGKQAWQFTLFRTVNGVEIVADIDQTSADGTGTAASWMNERLFIGVDDEGIKDIYWGGPLNVTEVVSENTAMLSFDEIKSIFGKMMRIKFEPGVRNSEFEIEYHITRIRLSLQRISEADSFTTGLLVPVWNFYGCVSYDGELQEESDWPILTINGIDGSVIDLHKGY